MRGIREDAAFDQGSDEEDSVLEKVSHVLSIRPRRVLVFIIYFLDLFFDFSNFIDFQSASFT